MTENMDDLVSSLSCSLGVSEEVNSPNQPHPRFADYKPIGRSQAESQQKRRNELFEQQKK